MGDRWVTYAVVGALVLLLLRPRSDKLLFGHPAILEAATVGVPDSFTGEAVKIFVVLKAGVQLSADELMTFCKENLAKYKLPKHIAFVDALPRSGVGKIDKRRLKAQHA